MRIWLGRAILILCLGAACFAQPQRAASCSGVIEGSEATVQQVLQAACIPIPGDGGLPLDQPITSYAVLNDDKAFILAYYIRTSDGTPHLPLRLLRLIKLTGEWAGMGLDKVTPGPDASPLDDLCLGSVLAIRRAGPFIYISTHGDPSAGCELVLSGDLKLKHTLYGWLLHPFSSGGVVFEESMRHFAPTHPAKLAIYDPTRDVEIPLYPPKNDRLRAAYMRRLKTEIPPDEKCHGENCAGPDDFESDIISSPDNPSGIVVNEQTHSLALIAQFDAVGLIDRDKTDDSEFTERVLYVFRGLPDRLTYRQYPASQMKERFHADKLEDLLQPATLRRIFADPPRQ